MYRVLIVAVAAALTLGSCAAAPSPVPTETVATEPVASPAAEADGGTLSGLLDKWDAKIAASDELELYILTLDIPDAVTAECEPDLPTDMVTRLNDSAAQAKADVDAVTAAKGGARALDIVQAWGPYVALVRDVC